MNQVGMGSMTCRSLSVVVAKGGSVHAEAAWLFSEEGKSELATR